MSLSGFFEFTDYKGLLRESLLARKAISPHFTFQKMAEACGVQKTYLSRSLGDSKVHLSSDALHAAALFLEFTQDQRDYLILLAQAERSTLPSRRGELLGKIDSLRRKYRKSESAIAGSEVIREESQGFQDYYLDPLLQIVHMFMTVQAYQREPERVRKELRLTRRQFGDIITRLLRLGVLTRGEKDGTYLSNKLSMHLSDDSPLVQPYRMLLRLKAGQRMQELSGDSFYSFSVVFSCDPVARKLIQEDFLKFLKTVERRVKDSDPSEVHQMNFDLLPWSRSADE
jgi:uncharacterized protein (TIGR02147 family)